MQMRLEDESGKHLEALSVRWTLETLERAASTETCCLRFIDAFGYTVFNKRQARILIEEIAAFDFEVGDEIMEAASELARRCAEGTHFYIRFVGN